MARATAFAAVFALVDQAHHDAERSNYDGTGANYKSDSRPFRREPAPKASRIKGPKTSACKRQTTSRICCFCEPLVLLQATGEPAIRVWSPAFPGRRGLLQGRLLARMTMGSGALVHGIGGGKQSVWICKTPLHQIRVWPEDGCNMITLITICYFGLVAVVKARAVESRGPRASGLLHRQTPVFRGRIRGTVMRPSGHCFFCLLSLAVPSESCILQQLAHLVGPTNLALATRCGMNRSALTASSRGADICP